MSDGEHEKAMSGVNTTGDNNDNFFTCISQLNQENAPKEKKTQLYRCQICDISAFHVLKRIRQISTEI